MAAVGGRLRVKGSCGTIRYYGNIAGTTGEWIGVEWDDPERGKHDGSKDGVRYFQCRQAYPRHSFAPYFISL
jgi:dynactin complex subunit